MLVSPPASQRSHGAPIPFSEMRARWALGEAAAVRRLAAEIELARNPFEWASHAAAERASAAGMVARSTAATTKPSRFSAPEQG